MYYDTKGCRHRERFARNVREHIEGNVRERNAVNVSEGSHCVFAIIETMMNLFANIYSSPPRRGNKSDEEEQGDEGGMRRCLTKSKGDGDRAQYQGQRSVTSTKMEHTSMTLVTYSGTTSKAEHHSGDDVRSPAPKWSTTARLWSHTRGPRARPNTTEGDDVRGPAPGSGTKNRGRAPHWTRNFGTGDHIAPHSND
jgi:hypothetical protein